MQFLKLHLKVCNRIPSDAVSHLGFYIKNGTIYHMVYTPRGVVTVSAKCEDCVFYKLLTATYVVTPPRLHGRRVKIIVKDSNAVRRLLAEHASEVVKVETLDYRRLVITERQADALLALANGHNLSSYSRELGVSKVAVLKSFKSALRKVVALVV